MRQMREGGPSAGAERDSGVGGRGAARGAGTGAREPSSQAKRTESKAALAAGRCGIASHCKIYSVL